MTSHRSVIAVAVAFTETMMRSTRCRAAAAAALLATAPALAAPDPQFRIVESVPVASIYGEPGVARTQAVWLDMIRNAHSEISVAAFYITDGPSLAPVLDALARRARAGITVRILLDESFMHETQGSLGRLQNVPHLELRILPMRELTGGVLHAKYMVVDAQKVFVGSQNFDWRALDQIHEIGAEITDDRFAKTFDQAFNLDWQVAADKQTPKALHAAQSPVGFAPVTVADPEILDRTGGDPLVVSPAFSPRMLTPPALDAEAPALARMIRGARQEFRLQVMTLSAMESYGQRGWWDVLDSALRDAAARGVAVHIIVADWALTEPMQSYLKSLADMPGITVKYSTVPAAPQGFIPYARVEHCKYAVADNDAAFIGTGNWEPSYFETTVDASVFVHGAGPAATLTRIFERDWDGPYVTTIVPGHEYAAAKNH